MRPVIPAVPLVPFPAGRSMSKSASSLHSPTKSASKALNPDAPTFNPSPPKQSATLRPAANDFIPSRTHSPFEDVAEVSEKMDDMKVTGTDEIMSVDSFSPSFDDFTDLGHGLIEEGVDFAVEDQVVIFTCDTKAIPESSLANALVTKLVASQTYLHSVQLNILAGPRLPSIHKVIQWFTDVLGPNISMIQRVQVVIIRCGECIGDKWTLTEIDLEQFHPLTDFITKLLKALPEDTRITWGSSVHHALKLRKKFHSMASSLALGAFKGHDDKGVHAYSQAIDSKIMKRIAANCLPRQETSATVGGRGSSGLHINTQQSIHAHSDTSLYVSSGNTSPGSSLNPDARPFYSKLLPLFKPCQRTSSPDPNDPFVTQLREVDIHRDNEWVPPVYDFGPEYDIHASVTDYLHVSNEQFASQQLSMPCYSQMSPRLFPAQYSPRSFHSQIPPQHAFGRQMPLQAMNYNGMNPQTAAQYPGHQHMGYNGDMHPVYASNQKHIKGQDKKTKKNGNRIGSGASYSGSSNQRRNFAVDDGFCLHPNAIDEYYSTGGNAYNQLTNGGNPYTQNNINTDMYISNQAVGSGMGFHNAIGNGMNSYGLPSSGMNLYNRTGNAMNSYFANRDNGMNPGFPIGLGSNSYKEDAIFRPNGNGNENGNGQGNGQGNKGGKKKSKKNNKKKKGKNKQIQPQLPNRGLSGSLLDPTLTDDLTVGGSDELKPVEDTAFDHCEPTKNAASSSFYFPPKDGVSSTKAGPSNFSYADAARGIRASGHVKERRDAIDVSANPFMDGGNPPRDAQLASPWASYDPDEGDADSHDKGSWTGAKPTMNW